MTPALGIRQKHLDIIAFQLELGGLSLREELIGFDGNELVFHTASRKLRNRKRGSEVANFIIGGSLVSAFARKRLKASPGAT